MSLFHNAKRIFRKLTPVEVASTELADAELQRLEAQSALDYAASMVSYHTKRIDRLRTFLTIQAAGAPATDNKAAAS
jgi:hypothetical protein